MISGTDWNHPREYVRPAEAKPLNIAWTYAEILFLRIKESNVVCPFLKATFLPLCVTSIRASLGLPAWLQTLSLNRLKAWKTRPLTHNHSKNYSKSPGYFSQRLSVWFKLLPECNHFWAVDLIKKMESINQILTTVPRGHRHLCEACDEDCRGQSYKGNYGLLQEVHFSHQDVGSFSTWRNLLHEIHVHLKPVELMELKNQLETNTNKRQIETEMKKRLWERKNVYKNMHASRWRNRVCIRNGSRSFGCY